MTLGAFALEGRDAELGPEPLPSRRSLRQARQRCDERACNRNDTLHQNRLCPYSEFARPRLYRSKSQAVCDRIPYEISMRITTCFGFAMLLTLAGAALAQQPPPPSGPPLMACGVHGDVEVLCGTHSPEDLELAPDGKYLIATQFVNLGRTGSAGFGMALYDLAKKTFTKMAVTDDPDKSWGDAACPGPIGDALVSHGESLKKRRDGKWALYVVNHGGRQSIEMYEL